MTEIELKSGSLLNPRKPNGTNRDNFVQTNPALLAQKGKIKTNGKQIGEKLGKNETNWDIFVGREKKELNGITLFK